MKISKNLREQKELAMRLFESSMNFAGYSITETKEMFNEIENKLFLEGKMSIDEVMIKDTFSSLGSKVSALQGILSNAEDILRHEAGVKILELVRASPAVPPFLSALIKEESIESIYFQKAIVEADYMPDHCFCVILEGENETFSMETNDKSDTWDITSGITSLDVTDIYDVQTERFFTEFLNHLRINFPDLAASSITVEER